MCIFSYKVHSDYIMTRIRFTDIKFDNLFFIYFFELDDITMTADGVDTYQIVKDAKRYKYAKISIIFKQKTHFSLMLSFSILTERWAEQKEFPQQI